MSDVERSDYLELLWQQTMTVLGATSCGRGRSQRLQLVEIPFILNSDAVFVLMELISSSLFGDFRCPAVGILRRIQPRAGADIQQPWIRWTDNSIRFSA